MLCRLALRRGHGGGEFGYRASVPTGSRDNHEQGCGRRLLWDIHNWQAGPEGDTGNDLGGRERDGVVSHGRGLPGRHRGRVCVHSCGSIAVDVVAGAPPLRNDQDQETAMEQPVMGGSILLSHEDPVCIQCRGIVVSLLLHMRQLQEQRWSTNHTGMASGRTRRLSLRTRLLGDHGSATVYIAMRRHWGQCYGQDFRATARIVLAVTATERVLAVREPWAGNGVARVLYSRWLWQVAEQHGARATFVVVTGWSYHRK